MNKILTMILQRFGLGLVTLFVVSAIIFLGVEFLPGDIAEALLGQGASPENVAALRHKLGLDVPAHTRYINWWRNVLQGDFGTSLANGRDIAELIKIRLANTLFLAVVAASVSVPLAIIFGILAALYRNSLYDRSVNVITLGAVSAPEFLVAYILILYFSVTLGWFPSLSNVDANTTFLERLHRVALPATTLTGVILAYMMRMVRASIINLLASAYIEMAHLKGMSKLRVIVKHALPNAWAPISNIIAISLAYLVVGVVVVEVVFIYPGLGQLMVDSVSTRDIPVVQACSMIFAGTYILLNLSADIVSICTNPRLLHPK
ncbi:MAG: ABC transporter permease [Pseudomonadales bacterium]|jgi:peptide/nickel transport system permease protein|nr:ABC transporter permease [Pseudomonadales bacterium]MEC8871380.1 ABC transporter permease [Pseudomonadota bacterium]|tara:strand:- start:3054 stop:4010 length:957 start_codon:yes stop_codon:yes gene_type:complete